MAPGLVPSPRHPGGCCLLLASLTGSERRGNFIHGARPRDFAPSSRRMSSPARIPDSEQEEGKLRPWRPASCCRPVIPGNTMTCSFHLKIFKGSTCTLWRRQHYPSDIFFDDPPDQRPVLPWQQTLLMHSRFPFHGCSSVFILYMSIYHCVLIRYISVFC